MRYPKYSLRNICRKASSIAGLPWAPNIEHLEYLDRADVVLSIGGDRYTLAADGGFNNLLFPFGSAIWARKKKFILWSASIGPFTHNRAAEKAFAKHLASIDLITAREQDTVSYLSSLGITKNVTPCGDPAYLLFPELRQQTAPADKLRIGINLSPLSATYTGKRNHGSVIQAQALAIGGLIEKLDAEISLIPHVVSSRCRNDDDRGYLQAIFQAMPKKLADRARISSAFGFREAKEEIINCHLIIAARMHCAINAIAACVPTLFLAYSQKAFAMAKYVYGDGSYVLPLGDFESGQTLFMVKSALSERPQIKKRLERRIPEICADSLAAGDSLARIIR